MIVPLIVVAVLLAAGWFVWRGGWSPDAGAPPAVRSVGATESTAAPTAGTATTAGPAPGSTPAPDRGRAKQAASRALEDCRRRVRSGDAVLVAARRGVEHWRGHVQAETDARAGRISASTKLARFAATRGEGPADQKRWTGALRSYTDRKGGCDPVAGADDPVADGLAACAARDEAQRPVIRAARAAMADWRDHLADMRRSRTHYVPDAERVWRDAYEAAPRNLEAYARAAASFDAPRC